jgi:hypothetical protein
MERPVSLWREIAVDPVSLPGTEAVEADLRVDGVAGQHPPHVRMPLDELQHRVEPALQAPSPRRTRCRRLEQALPPVLGLQPTALGRGPGQA